MIDFGYLLPKTIRYHLLFEHCDVTVLMNDSISVIVRN